ncbi:hypothetical protein [Clostridium sardiniense]|uniref:hypothetical protein n=1 Tax=Clostridium sardiniense TaxID=29369 RepID=UPI003D350327
MQCNKFTDWIEFNTNGILVLTGAFSTIIAVLLSINYTRKVEEENRKRQLIKTCIILHYELSLFLNSLFDKFYEYIVMYSNENFNIQQMPNIRFSSSYSGLYKLNEDFKPLLYELMSIDNTNKSLELFEFFKRYEDCLEKISDSRNFGLESLKDILNYCFNDKYDRHICLSEFRYEQMPNGLNTLKELTKDEKDLLINFIESNRNIHQKNNYNLIKDECSDKILEIMNFLEKYKNYK